MCWFKNFCVQNYFFFVKKGFNDTLSCFSMTFLARHSKLIIHKHRVFRLNLWISCIYDYTNSFFLKLVIFKWIVTQNVVKNVFSISSKLLGVSIVVFQPYWKYQNKTPIKVTFLVVMCSEMNVWLNLQ